MSDVLVPVAEANFGAERVTHLYANDLYYAHLSLYYFALQFVQNGQVLDAGSGGGYGSAYLAEHGATFVHGIDVSSEAIAFSQHHFQRPNLQYQVMSLEQITGFEAQFFDLIYSSNVLEHVPNVVAFLRSAWELLNRDGVMVIAVPPVVNWELQADNLANPFHFNMWTPRQWHHALNQFFADIQCYTHMPSSSGVSIDFSHTPEQTLVDERDFVFEPVTAEQLMYVPSLTAVYVVRTPRPLDQVLPKNAALTFVDDSYTLELDRPQMRVAAAIELLRRTDVVRGLLAHFADESQHTMALERAHAQITELRSTLHQTQAQIQKLITVHSELRAAVREKNEHIVYLEGLLKQIQNGRVMKVLGAVNKLRSRKK